MVKIANFIAAILHLSIYLVLIYNLGVIKGIIAIYVAYKTLEVIFSKAFGLQMMRGVDIIFFLEKPNNHTICTACIILDKKPKENPNGPLLTGKKFISDILLPKIIKGKDIYRTKMVDIFGYKFWKVSPENEETMKEVMKKITVIDTKFENQNDLANYMQELQSSSMPFDEFQWDFKISENYQKDQLLIFCRVHHGLCDGMATMMLLASIDGNKNLSAIPQMRDISIWNKIVLFTLSPFYFIHSLYVDLLIQNDPSPYELKNGYSGKKSLSVSKLYNFEELR